MKRISMAVALLTVGPNCVSGQDAKPPHQETVAPLNARYEIVQSPLAARWTFRLDRFSGRVSQIVKTADEDVTWQDMEADGLPLGQAATRPRFQIFSSAIAARFTFLLDTETGDTWQLATGRRKGPNGEEEEVTVWQSLVR